MHEIFLSKKDEKNLSSNAFLFLNSTFLKQCSLAGVINGAQSFSEQLDLLAAFLGINARTVRRWLDGNSEPHPCAVRLLFIKYMGFPQEGKWRGWKLEPDKLISPSGEELTPDMIGRLWLWRNDKSMLQAKVRRLEREVSDLKKGNSAETLARVRQAAALLADLVEMPATLAG